ncbi:hypothetical protein BH10ACI4_BH10ACI4_29610 [soil metagenome]
MGVQVPPFAPNPHFYPQQKVDFMSQTKPEVQNPQPAIKLSSTDDYRDGYANSVQVRMSVWDFFLVFGTMTQDSPEEVNLRNFQGVYLSPQQAKALWNVLGHNLAQYEQTFGTLALEPQVQSQGGPVH